ncbi:MAG: ATP-binding cassette domain-containing protein, partial [Paracoccaceae bacterium]
MTNATGLVLEHLTIIKGNQRLVALSAHIKPGKILTLMAPSGAGKSTALSAIMGALDPFFVQYGKIFLNGTEVTNLPIHQRCIGILLQDDLLFPHMSVAANLAFAMPQDGLSKSERQSLIQETLEQVDMPLHANSDPSTLSNGEKARVALVRCLLAQPKALLLDEPFSGLDQDLRSSLRVMVFDLARARELPVIMVTHDVEDARATGGLSLIHIS